MNNYEEYPLYPTLTERGEEEAQRIMDSFKPRLIKLFDEILGDLYTDVSFYVESDHWSNYRNKIMNGLKGYKQGSTTHGCCYEELRKAIYDNNKTEIIKDLNGDLVEENKDLRAQVERLREYREGYRYG